MATVFSDVHGVIQNHLEKNKTINGEYYVNYAVNEESTRKNPPCP